MFEKVDLRKRTHIEHNCHPSTAVMRSSRAFSRRTSWSSSRSRARASRVTAISNRLPSLAMEGFSQLDDLARCAVLHVARDEGLGGDGRWTVQAGDAKEQQEDARNG